MNLNSKWQKWGGLLFILIVPTIVQLLFAKYGFNPTDYGFILAGARRILDGQIPFLDFVSIRTVLSYYLWAPFLIFGGKYTIYITRYFVLLEFAVIIWVWVNIVSQSFLVFKNMNEKWVIAIIGFAFSLFYFRIEPWQPVNSYTIC